MLLLKVTKVSFILHTYPGTGFFEAFTNVTEGSGTLSPFKTIGAPWINSSNLVSQLQSYDLPGMIHIFHLMSLVY